MAKPKKKTYRADELAKLAEMLPENHLLGTVLKVDPGDKNAFRTFVNAYLTPKEKEVLKAPIEKLPLYANDEEVNDSPFYKWRFVIAR